MFASHLDASTLRNLQTEAQQRACLSNLKQVEQPDAGAITLFSVIPLPVHRIVLVFFLPTCRTGINFI